MNHRKEPPQKQRFFFGSCVCGDPLPGKVYQFSSSVAAFPGYDAERAIQRHRKPHNERNSSSPYKSASATEDAAQRNQAKRADQAMYTKCTKEAHGICAEWRIEGYLQIRIDKYCQSGIMVLVREIQQHTEGR